MGTLYQNISKLCELRKISAYKLCKDIGIQPSIITDLKKGRRSGLSAATANKIANYFNVSVDYLLTGEEPNQKEKPSEETEDITFDDFTYAMYNESKDLSEASKQKLLEMARFFKEHLDNEKR